jgi:hypothetical protein
MPLKLLALALLTVLAGACAADQAPDPLRMGPAEIGRALDATLAQERYAWRLPRRPPPSSGPSVLSEMMREMARSLADALSSAFKALGKLFRWLSGLVHPDSESAPTLSAPFEMRSWIISLAWLLLTALCCVLAIGALRAWKKGGREGLAVLSESSPLKPDLAKEELSGSEFPAAEWGQLARDCIERGEYRLALRAYYLAALSQLGERQWLTLKKSRTGGEYLGELKRRAPSRHDLQGLFAEMGQAFERAWYGESPLQRSDAEAFAAALERMAGLAAS